MLPPPHPNLLRTDADPLSRCRPVFPPGAGKRTAELWAADAEFRQRFHRLVSDDELQSAGSAIEEARKQWAAVSGKPIAFNVTVRRFDPQWSEFPISPIRGPSYPNRRGSLSQLRADWYRLVIEDGSCVRQSRRSSV